MRMGFFSSFMVPNNGSKTAIESLGVPYYRLDFEKGTAEFTGGSWKIHRPDQAVEETGWEDRGGVPGASGALTSAEGKLLDLFSAYVRGGEAAAVGLGSDGRQNLTTVGLIQGLGRSSELGQVLDFDAFMEEAASEVGVGGLASVAVVEHSNL